MTTAVVTEIFLRLVNHPLDDTIKLKSTGLSFAIERIYPGPTLIPASQSAI